jgi:hypothetical protein
MTKLPHHLRRDAKILLLATTPALADCRAVDLVALASAAELVQCDKHDLVAFQSDPRLWWWLVIDGELEVLRDSSPPTRITAGQGLGLDDTPRASAVTIVALKPTTVLVASRRTLIGTIDEHPRLAEAVRRASVGLVEELEDLFRRPSYDRTVAPDHDRTLDQDRVRH